MINILDGENQEIHYEENKESALQNIILHIFTVGEIYTVGYWQDGVKDIIIALGIGEGNGPGNYRILVDKGVRVVSAVYDQIPDVAEIALNEVHLARDEEDGNMYFLCRYRKSNDEVVCDKVPVLKNTVVIESWTGNIYLTSPDDYVNLFDIILSPRLTKAGERDGNVFVDLEWKGKSWNDLFFLTAEEKESISQAVYSSSLSIRITPTKIGSTGVSTDSKDPADVIKVKYTLEAFWEGEPVELDEIPEGWKKVDLTYVLETPEFSTGEVLCRYQGNSKTAECTLNMDDLFFVSYSEGEPERMSAREIYTRPRTLRIKPAQGEYAWFIFPESLTPTFLQTGLLYIGETKDLGEIVWNGKNLGKHIGYRSILQGNGKNQDIVIL